MKHFCFFISCFFISFFVSAQTTAWIGPSNGSWSDAANWDAGVPTSTSDIVFDGSNPLLTGGVINIADASQPNPAGSFNSLRVLNNATVNLSGSTSNYFYFAAFIQIDTGSVVNIGGTSASRFEIGTNDFISFVNIDGTLDMQGTGTSSNPTIFVPTTITFGPPPPVIATIRGKVILSGTNAQFNSNILVPLFENGSQLIVTRNGGACPKANFKDGSLIKIQGVTTSPTLFNSSAAYDGTIEWDCPGQTISGSSALILPSSSFAYFDSLVINNTGVTGSVRLATNPSGYYVKNIVVNNGVLEFGSPTGSGPYSCIVDNIHQLGGTIVGNAAGVPGFDNAFEPDTINVTGNFIQDGGLFDFSNRTPVNAAPNASCVLQVAGNLKIAGTFKLSQPLAAQNCAVVFNGSSNQNFEVTGLYINKVKTVLNNTSTLAGVSLHSNVILPDSLVFRIGYLFLNNFNLTNPLPVQAVSNPFQTHAVTNGTGFFIQKNVSTVPVGIPIGASTGTVNPLIIGLAAGTIDIAAKVEVGVNPPTVFPDIAVDRTWQIMPIDFFLPSDLGVSFGYSDLTPLPGDGNVNFSYASNNEIGLYAGGNWQVVSLPGGIAPAGTNPYAITSMLPGSLFVPNVPAPLVISNVSGVVAVPNILAVAAEKTASGSLVKWGVSEANSNSSFEIQRSTDARSFAPIGLEASQRGVLNYSFADNNIQPGTNYYRIKSQDASGRFKYSAVVAVINKAEGLVITSVLPTVVNSTVSIMISSAVKAPAQFHITDMLGRVVKKISATLNEGSNQLSIDCGSLAKGAYQISAFSESSQSAIRFVKD